MKSILSRAFVIVALMVGSVQTEADQAGPDTMLNRSPDAAYTAIGKGTNSCGNWDYHQLPSVLKTFCAAWLPVFYEIAGLGQGRCTDPTPPLWLHVVDVNLQMCRASAASIPAGYIRICDDGGDYSFLLDTGTVDERGESPVVVLGPGRDKVVICDSFLAFVERAAADQLEINPERFSGSTSPPLPSPGVRQYTVIVASRTPIIGEMFSLWPQSGLARQFRPG